jgi:hypothetical protein
MVSPLVDFAGTFCFRARGGVLFRIGHSLDSRFVRNDRSVSVRRCEPWFYLRLGTAGLTLLLVLRGCLWLCTCLGVTLCRAVRLKLRLSLAPGSVTYEP